MTRTLRRVLWLLLLSAAPVSAQTIDTFPSWNGSSFISAFGVVNTATYGQIITVPSQGFAGSQTLTSFSFQIGVCSEAVTFRGHVYAWDGTKATGPSLFDSAVQSVPADGVYHLVTFSTGSLVLPPGQYVLFASTSEDQVGAPNSGCRWGSIDNDTTYPGGRFVFLNNGPNPAQWTTVTWNATFSRDLAFQAVFAPGTLAAIPTLSEWGMMLMVCGLIAVATWSLRKKTGPNREPS